MTQSLGTLVQSSSGVNGSQQIGNGTHPGTDPLGPTENEGACNGDGWLRGWERWRFSSLSRLAGPVPPVFTLCLFFLTNLAPIL